MPTKEHEFPIQLFRDSPALAALLLNRAFGLDVPSYTEARLESGDLTDCFPTEYRADAVVSLNADGLVLAVVVEVQRGRDRRKRLSWPVYLATLRARLDCPAVLLVLCPDDATAAWCAAPIDMGHPGWVLAPLVAGPERLPVLASVEQGAREPELAVLSAIAHGGDTTVIDTFVDAMGGIEDIEQAQRYVDHVMAVLPEAARNHLEKLMATETHKYQSEFARRRMAEGEVKGEARSILKFLAARGVEVADEERERILGCAAPEVLDEWLRRAVTARTAAELFG
ncbi:hypothetical protein [Actinorugispora endophytica]|uniref:Uncharacterized protein n=1 Tax=Actinorugispora endophytica TaxID=1605990 RepID=A0A4R6UKQ5_9ACTN|nr:hypothetical protein [Actinorugispora endophytica]TDQ47570.1 hypothetical protein EV190_12138 [Actinorugispora endophytica]